MAMQTIITAQTPTISPATDPATGRAIVPAADRAADPAATDPLSIGAATAAAEPDQADELAAERERDPESLREAAPEPRQEQEQEQEQKQERDNVPSSPLISRSAALPLSLRISYRDSLPVLLFSPCNPTKNCGIHHSPTLTRCVGTPHFQRIFQNERIHVVERRFTSE